MKHLLLFTSLAFLLQCSLSKDTKDTSKHNEEIEKKNMQRNLYLKEVLTNKKNENLISSNMQSSTTPTQIQQANQEEEPYETLEGRKEISLLSGWTKIYIDWIKNKAISIKGRDGKPIKELEGKIRYSYSITPIKKNGKFTSETMPVILFQTTNNAGKIFTVNQLFLEDHPTINLNKRKYAVYYKPPHTEYSTEPEYFKINSFWIMNQNEKLIPALTQSRYIKASIEVLNRLNNHKQNYEILLESSYLIKLINDSLNKYPELKNKAPTFKL